MLETAIAKLRALPAAEQNAIAALIIEEVEDEARWDATFASSLNILERMAQQAEEEDRKGLTQDLDADTL